MGEWQSSIWSFQISASLSKPITFSQLGFGVGYKFFVELENVDKNKNENLVVLTNYVVQFKDYFKGLSQKLHVAAQEKSKKNAENF
jgi:hypothetical protein